MPEQVKLRRITAEDWQAWREIRVRSVEESPEAFAAQVRTITAEQDREPRWRDRIMHAVGCWIAFDGERPVGMVALDRMDDGRLQLASMFVGSEARRCGVGAALIDAVVRESVGHDLYLRVMAGNDPAAAAYQRAGFVLTDTTCDPDGCLTMTYRG